MSEAATRFTAGEDLGSRKSLDASDATFGEVCFEFVPVAILIFRKLKEKYGSEVGGPA
jgi:hypothetical protein